MRLPYYVVDAFTQLAFGGNPAGIVYLTEWLPDATLQAIAAQNNLSETAFLVEAGGTERGYDFQLRWFTPAAEVDLCGHATLAPSHHLFFERQRQPLVVRYQTRSGILTVKGEPNGRLTMSFPQRPGVPCPVPDELVAALGGGAPVEVRLARDYLVVYRQASEVVALRPNFTRLAELEAKVIVTAPGDPGSGLHFVSRFFAPAIGVPEDPVTGSAHCTLAPYWGERLGLKELRARQVSTRGGDLWLALPDAQMVAISGYARTYLRGEIVI